MINTYCYAFCFVNATATTEIYTYLHTLSLHDSLPIWTWSDDLRGQRDDLHELLVAKLTAERPEDAGTARVPVVLQEIGRAHVCTPASNAHLVCRLLLAKKYNTSQHNTFYLSHVLEKSKKQT